MMNISQLLLLISFIIAGVNCQQDQVPQTQSPAEQPQQPQEQPPLQTQQQNETQQLQEQPPQTQTQQQNPTQQLQEQPPQQTQQQPTQQLQEQPPQQPQQQNPTQQPQQQPPLQTQQQNSTQQPQQQTRQQNLTQPLQQQQNQSQFQPQPVLTLNGRIVVGLENFARLKNFKPIQNTRIFPTVLNDMYNNALYYIAAPAIERPMMLLFKYNDRSNCTFNFKSGLKYIAEYQAIGLSNGMIIITGRTTSRKGDSVASPDDKWELVELEPESCAKKFRTLTIDDGFYAESITITPDTQEFIDTTNLYDVWMKLSKIGEHSRLFAQTYNTANSEKLALKYYESIQYEHLVVDKNSSAYYVYRKKTNRDMEVLFKPEGYNYDVSYILPNRAIVNSPKILTNNKLHVTFCHGNDNNKRILECSMFYTDTGIKFGEQSRILDGELQTVYVQNLDNYVTLVFYVEKKPDKDSPYILKIQFIDYNKVLRLKEIFRSPKKIIHIYYYEGFAKDCLVVGTIDNNLSTRYEHCFGTFRREFQS